MLSSEETTVLESRRVCASCGVTMPKGTVVIAIPLRSTQRGGSTYRHANPAEQCSDALRSVMVVPRAASDGVVRTTTPWLEDLEDMDYA